MLCVVCVCLSACDWLLQDVTFALAVKAHLYPNKVISIWVLMLSMIKR